MFSRYETLVQVVSGVGSQFKCKFFETIPKEWGFTHTLSSPTRIRCDEKAEVAVINNKKLLKNCRSSNDEFWKTLRAGYLQHIFSPGQELMIGKKLHEFVPRFLNTDGQLLVNKIKENIMPSSKRKATSINIPPSFGHWVSCDNP